MFLLQVIPSLSSVFLLVVSCMMAVYLSDGISWLAVPDKHTNVEQGCSFGLHWHYEMEKNETFLSSKIYFFGDTKPLPMTIASRHGRDNYDYVFPWMNSSFFSFIAGKNNVTLMVHNAAVGQNITYCCEVEGKTTAGKKNNPTRCSKVFVYAVPQIIFHIPQLSCKQGDWIKLQCNTTGFPSPQVEWIHDDTHQRIGSSSHISLNITGKRSGGRYCCVADNGFGRDTACTVVNVTALPRFKTTIRTKYNMTVNGVTLQCNTTGVPTPNITWTSGDTGKIVGTGKYYKVPYVKCVTKTMRFFCHARNEMGNITSPEIHVNAMTKDNCSTADKGLDETTPTALKPEIIAVICACIVVGGLVVVAAVCLWRRIKTPKVKNMDENTSEDPIDAEDPEREGPQLSLARITSNNDNYATVEGFGVPTSLSHAETNEQPEGEEPQYERLVNPEL